MSSAPRGSTPEPEAADPRDATIEILKIRLDKLTRENQRLRALMDAGRDELELREELVRLRSEITQARELAAAVRTEREEATQVLADRDELRKRVDFLERQWMEQRHQERRRPATEEQDELRRRIDDLTEQAEAWRRQVEEMSSAAQEQAKRAGADAGNAAAVLEAENQALRARMQELQERNEEALGEVRRERLTMRRLQLEVRAFRQKYGITDE